nr:immunoglobulin light chain junction region [Macaca mulatta]MOV34254.1 immunoglobulin light chain junction region [Macaca mulatta]MOV34289.1 immunoglobulin light chain junction region [Macaca mulatta]MOV34476.1 immunoglobulin light chain junction region [Macaca mulatta]MOV34591.1 immunoglobulin light chain junction region [Macaca mulatta]
CQHAYGTPFTF